MMITVGSILMLLAPTSNSNFMAYLKDLDASFIYCHVSHRSYVCVQFTPVKYDNVVRYGIYRSILGFEGLLPVQANLTNKTLEISLNSGPMITVTFNNTQSFITQINEHLSGIKANISAKDNTKFLLRVENPEDSSSLQIIGGSILSEIGIQPSTITPKSQKTLLEYVTATSTDMTTGVEYCDIDGDYADYYCITVVNTNNVESLPSEFVQAQDMAGLRCLISGTVIDIQGQRMVDIPGEVKVLIKALEYPQTYCHNFIDTKETLTILTNSRGYFEVSLLQKTIVEITIEEISYHRIIKVPTQYRALLKNIPVHRDNMLYDRI